MRDNSVYNMSVYNMNKVFWTTRPLTLQMLAWASGDLTSLFFLYESVLFNGIQFSNLYTAVDTPGAA